jgi:hypothetical protein
MRTLAMLLTTLITACAMDSAVETTSVPVPADRVARDICPGGCPGEVLQEIEDPDAFVWVGITDGVWLGTPGDTASTYDTDACALLPDSGPCAQACVPRKTFGSELTTKGPVRCELEDGRLILLRP